MENKLLKVMHIITDLGDGGAEGALYRLVKARNNLSDEVVSLTDLGKYGSMLQDAGFHVTTLGFKRGRVSFSGLRQLYKTIKESRPDVVQTWLYHADFLGGLVARLARVPHVYWGIRHSTFSRTGGTNTAHIIARISAPLSRWVPRRIICAGESALQAHVELGYDASKMVVIPNGYNLEQFYPSKEKREHFREAFLPAAKSRQRPLIGFVARFNEQKDHPTLFSAMREVQNLGHKLTLVLVGTEISKENERLLSQIWESGLNLENVLLLGQQSDIAGVMNGLDLHVMSSAFGEAFPNVLAEAMACGTPCVATNVGDAQLIIGDTGWIVPPRNSSELAQSIVEALKEMQENADQWEDRKIHAHQRIADNFSIMSMVKRYEAIWSSE